MPSMWVPVRGDLSATLRRMTSAPATIRIAFLGDINGAPGRMALDQQLPILHERFRPDRIVANAENARNGSGLTP